MLRHEWDESVTAEWNGNVHIPIGTRAEFNCPFTTLQDGRRAIMLIALVDQNLLYPPEGLECGLMTSRMARFASTQLPRFLCGGRGPL